MAIEWLTSGCRVATVGRPISALSGSRGRTVHQPSHKHNRIAAIMVFHAVNNAVSGKRACARNIKNVTRYIKNVAGPQPWRVLAQCDVAVRACMLNDRPPSTACDVLDGAKGSLLQGLRGLEHIPTRTSEMKKTNSD